MKELIIIGKNIERLRKAKTLTQEDLCGLTELDLSYLSEIENGKENVSIKVLVSIANALETSLETLIAEI